MPPRSEKAQDLIRYAREEAERYRAGEITHLSRLTELAAKFGYRSSSGVYRRLTSAGISREGVLKPHERSCSFPMPSHESAWFIGVLAASGEFNREMSSFSLRRRSTKARFLEKFKRTGERLFEINGHESNYTKVYKDHFTDFTRISFLNAMAARFLGDLRRSRFHLTILNRHSWLLNNEKYLWSFLEGYFEANGGIYDRGNHYYTICFRTASYADGIFLQIF